MTSHYVVRSDTLPYVVTLQLDGVDFATSPPSASLAEARTHAAFMTLQMLDDGTELAAPDPIESSRPADLHEVPVSQENSPSWHASPHGVSPSPSSSRPSTPGTPHATASPQHEGVASGAQLGSTHGPVAVLRRARDSPRSSHRVDQPVDHRVGAEVGLTREARAGNDDAPRGSARGRDSPLSSRARKKGREACRGAGRAAGSRGAREACREAANCPEGDEASERPGGDEGHLRAKGQASGQAKAGHPEGLAKTATSILYEYVTRHKLGRVTFTERTGRRIHVTSAFLDGIECGVGSGATKSIAKHNASFQALQLLDPDLAAHFAPCLLGPGQPPAQQPPAQHPPSPKPSPAVSEASKYPIERGSPASVGPAKEVSTSLGDAMYSALLYAMWQIDRSTSMATPPTYDFSGGERLADLSLGREAFTCKASLQLGGAQQTDAGEALVSESCSNLEAHLETASPEEASESSQTASAEATRTSSHGADPHQEAGQEAGSLAEAELICSLGAAQLEDRVIADAPPSSRASAEASSLRRGSTLTAVGFGATKKDAKHEASKQLLTQLLGSANPDEALAEALRRKQAFALSKRSKRHAAWEPTASGLASGTGAEKDRSRHNAKKSQLSATSRGAAGGAAPDKPSRPPDKARTGGQGAAAEPQQQKRRRAEAGEGGSGLKASPEPSSLNSLTIRRPTALRPSAGERAGEGGASEEGPDRAELASSDHAKPEPKKNRATTKEDPASIPT